MFRRKRPISLETIVSPLSQVRPLSSSQCVQIRRRFRCESGSDYYSFDCPQVLLFDQEQKVAHEFREPLLDWI